jgi:hypothetical protein
MDEVWEPFCCHRGKPISSRFDVIQSLTNKSQSYRFATMRIIQFQLRDSFIHWISNNMIHFLITQTRKEPICEILDILSSVSKHVNLVT